MNTKYVDKDRNVKYFGLGQSAGVVQLYSSTRIDNYRFSKCLVKKRKVCTIAVNRYKTHHHVYTYTKKYVLRNSPVTVCKECMVPVNRYKTHHRIYTYTEKYVLRHSPVIVCKMCTVPGNRYKTHYCIYTCPKKYATCIIPVNISKVKQISLKKYSSNLNVRESTNTLAVHDSTEYSMYMGNNRLRAAPPHPPADSQ
jgi:hypothetical protein